MADFLETSEFELSELMIRSIWVSANSLGWARHGGTLMDPHGSVSPDLFVPGHALGARFERDGQVIGLHVYTSEPAAGQLTVPVNFGRHVEAFIEMVAGKVGVDVQVERRP